MSHNWRGHWQTIWPALVLPKLPSYKNITYQRQRWACPDDDFIDVDFATQDAPDHAPILVMFHGLEGTSRSHYALKFAKHAQSVGWHFAVPHFRGCSGEINKAPRAYHSGDFDEIDWILRRFKKQHAGDVYAVGVSLGGNALMHWAGELQADAAEVVKGVVSICSPLDLTQSGHHLGQGINQKIYTPMFLKTMKHRALGKWQQYPQLFDKEKMLKSLSLYDFDNAFTAPLHGFASTMDYWQRASAKQHLHKVTIPALAINALNDPFIPMDSLTNIHEAGNVMLWQPPEGGHVGMTMHPLAQMVHAFFKQGIHPKDFHHG